MSTKGKVELGIGVKKPVRTISGVTPLTVVVGPRKCDHGTCIYCPGGDVVPQSYTDKSPAVMRAMRLNFDSHEQTLNRLDALKKMNHPTDKIEIIIIGGTFLQYSREYKYNFIKGCFDALNGKISKDLGEAKKLNEKSKHRCVALCIENRPDNCKEEDIKEMLEFGCTRVELGVQVLDDEIYRKINRGHTVQDVIDSTRRLRNAGFKIGYHIMPGLPYSSFENDLEKYKLVFGDERFRPDQLKLYPCQVVDDSPLAKIYKKIGYEPYNDEQIKKILSEMISQIPDYCRIMRVMREIPAEKMMTKAASTDMRTKVENDLKDKGIKVKEIRMREVGFNKGDLDLDVRIKSVEYEASEGKEFFLEFVNKDDVLFGLLRLRLSEYGAMVRELHVYGQAINLGEEGSESQHRGLGKMLMKKAEEISKKNGFDKLSVISGVGVREYYRKLGYELEGPYMVKLLIQASQE